jgi:histidinol-phosphate aminotransferase
MLRRRFLRSGAAAVAAPAVLPLLPHRLCALTGDRARPMVADELRLNANENPLGPSARAREAAVAAMDQANRYPTELPRPLREALALKHGVGVDGIVLGNGSTELIQVVIQASALDGLTIVSPMPTFDDVGRYAAPSRVRVVDVPLTADHQHDLEAMRLAVRRITGPALVYVCNPNNPTGTVTSCDDVEALLDRLPPDVVVLVDEAYFEYVESAGYRSFDRRAYERTNVVVLRTFSKVYGMAGMRLGYAIAHPETAPRLRAFATDVNADQLVLAAALASLEEDGHVRRSLEANRAAKRELQHTLDELGIESLPSHANFLMHRIRGDLATYVSRMREAGARVGRPFPPMLGHNRISLGTPDEMSRFGDILRSFRAKDWV